jgi:dUTPase
MNKIVVKYQILDEIAGQQLKTESRSYDNPAGTDIYTTQPLTLPPGTRTLAKTGLAI